METPIDSYDLGNSKFYVYPETPIPVPVKEAQNSPVAPPRTRHNPFNKPEMNTHVRPASVRNTSRNDESIRHSDPASLPPTQKITFRELHNSYGRPILQDFNIWKREQREKSDNAVTNLISF